MKKLSWIMLVCMFLIPLVSAIPDYNIVYDFDNLPISSNQNVSLGYFTVAALNESVSNLNIFYSDIPFKLIFSPQTITTLTTDLVRVNISAETTSATTAGNYSGKLFISSDSVAQKQVNLNIEVLKDDSFVVTHSAFITTLDSGLSGIFGNITIKNDGNINQLFTISVEGTISELITTVDQLLVYKGTSDTFSISYLIPKDQDLSEYTGQIIINSDQNETNQTINTSITIRDIIPPELISANFSDVMATQINVLQVETIDNVAVKNVTAEIYYFVEDGNDTARHNLNNITFTKVLDRNRWDYDFEDTEDLMSYYIDVYVRDEANNLNMTTRQFKVIELESLTHDTVIKFPAVKYGDFSHVIAFNIAYETSVKVSIDSMEYNYTWEFAIERPDGKKRYFEDADEFKTFSDVGNYTLMVKGEKEGEFYGSIKFELIDTHKSVELLEFSGKFMNCTIPKEFKDLDFYGGSIELELQDRATCGNNSFYRYIIEYPIDSYVEGEHKYIVSYKGELEKEQSHRETLDRKDSSIAGRTVALVLMSLMFIIFILWVVYAMMIKPYTYWRR